MEFLTSPEFDGRNEEFQIFDIWTKHHRALGKLKKVHIWDRFALRHCVLKRNNAREFATHPSRFVAAKHLNHSFANLDSTAPSVEEKVPRN